jgi:hypothetical protein
MSTDEKGAREEIIRSLPAAPSDYTLGSFSTKAGPALPACNVGGQILLRNDNVALFSPQSTPHTATIAIQSEA